MSKNNSTTPPPSPADRPITTTAAAVTLHEWKWSTAWIPSSFYLDSADQTRPVGPRGVLHGSLPSPAPFKSNVSAPAGIITTSRLIHRSRRHHICIVVSGEGGIWKGTVRSSRRVPICNPRGCLLELPGSLQSVCWLKYCCRWQIVLWYVVGWGLEWKLRPDHFELKSLRLMTADEEATLFCRGSTRRDGKVERYTKSCFFFRVM